MRLLLIIVCVLTLQACSVSRVNPEKLTPKKNANVEFPIEATVLVYVPLRENEEKILMHYGYGSRYLHSPGNDLKEAALSVAPLYFENSSALSLDKDTHYVLKLEGKADIDMVFGFYTGEITGTLYNSMGETVYSATVLDRTATMIVADKNAFFNSYVNASKKFLDGLFKEKSTQLVSFSQQNQAAIFSSTGNSEGQSLEIISTGSGFFVNGTGQVVTNKHVVSQCMSISVSIDGEETDAKLLFADEEADIAVLDTGLRNGNYLKLQPANHKVRLGEEIIAIGFPLHGVLSSDASLTTGNISSLSGLSNDKSSIQISSPIQPGNSGGPLLNKNGHLVGVVKSKLNTLRLAQYTGDIAQNVNFAINVPTLIQALDDSGYEYSRAESKEYQKLSTPDIADDALSYTVQVMCRG